MMKRLVCLLLLSPWRPLLAQPGGGGGLVVKAFYLQRGRQLVPTDTSTVRARVFLLTDTTARARVVYEHTSPTFALEERVSESFAAFLPPAADTLPLAHRLLLTYGQQVMMVDFIGVISPNGMGFRQQADSLVFMPGHFRLRLAKYPVYNEEDNSHRAYDLTPTSLAGWSAVKAMTYQPAVDLDFLSEPNLTAAYFQDRGEQRLNLVHQPRQALADLRRAFRLGLPLKVQPAAYETRANAYRSLGQYDSAATALTAAIQLVDSQGNASLDRNKNEDAQRLEEWHSDRIRDNTQARKYDQALAGYNELIRRSTSPFSYLRSRSLLKARHFRGRPEYIQATTDLTQLLKPLPPEPPAGYLDEAYTRWHYARGEKQSLLFDLGYVEYEKGERRAAFRHWTAAYELAEGVYLSSGMVAHFDALLAKHPHEPELLLGRAFAHLNSALLIAGNNNNHDVALLHCQAALADLAEAQRRGIAEKRIHPYRSRLQGLAAEYDKIARFRSRPTKP
ncbi:hypothetical protein ACFST9_00235 [Hymenobacter monticola]|uniref:Tetratricopeptide repeat protein n=1 Tax=Hymenobacter monticola TaxID=1705399 RepID=A0ABY4BCK4_9BACT|nr:hypothetical protein [Hymenobacter monticola]UOE36810.1 hypothetical protein MTP16_25370 [Hymenobacter monticola]